MTADIQDQGVTEAAERAEHQGDELQKGIDHVGERIAESKTALKAVEEDKSIPTGAADVDDEDDDDDGDSGGFDDPEADEDEDDDE